MNISKTSIYRPTTTLMFSLALVFLGVISAQELAVQRLPDITFPALSYTAQMTNGDLSPEETNDQLTRPVEKMVSSLKGVREMQSTTSSDFFYGFAQFDYGTDMRFRMIELQDKVNEWLVTQQGGSSNSARRINVQINTFSTEQESEQFIETILTVPLGHEAKIPYCTDLIERKLKSIDGIAKVDIAGVMQPNLVLETSNDELQARGLEVGRLVDTINSHARGKSWLGTLKDGRREHEIYFDMRVKDLDALLTLPVDDAGVYSVGTLSAPRKEVKEGERVFRIDGKKRCKSRSVRKKTKTRSAWGGWFAPTFRTSRRI